MRKTFKKRYKTNRYYFVYRLRIRRWIKESASAFEKTMIEILGGDKNGE